MSRIRRRAIVSVHYASVAALASLAIGLLVVSASLPAGVLLWTMPEPVA